MKKVAFITLGCKVNTYETEGMKRIFEENGYEVVDFGASADVCVINTCTVTHLSDKKSRQMIRRARRINPGAIIAAVGCYAQVSPDEVSSIEGVNLVIGNNHKADIVRLVNEASYGTQKTEVSERKCLNDYEKLWIDSYSERIRAILKIQDGCDQFCSYCIIPYARGNVRSRNSEDIINEAERLSENGFSEIVLTGIHLTSYGKDTGDESLVNVLYNLNGIMGIKRIRLGSIEPLYMSQELICTLSGLEKLCPHFHLSLQSGCDETLMRMNRRYTTSEYMDIVNNIRKNFLDAAITTDIMVGFPGETEEEFEKTCSFVEKVGFSQAHIFQYSIRKGTKAAGMPNQVSPEIKEKRSKILMDICEKTKNNYRDQYLGRVMEVLFENEKESLWEGHTINYIPVRVASKTPLSGSICSVKLMEKQEDFVLGQII
ncbi:MAG: tRNA (N(6)-L-threonylcarbamoyladenosine(37)-C(2))-methylthiotransferase MtaB [Ruminiclostridium sp.]|nr:tRNA (N(6)-L-threonylcarbamoyladenosine(37)-C(2))-methylthiotransferase MtaB [Ruminiclostridium sp.]